MNKILVLLTEGFSGTTYHRLLTPYMDLKKQGYEVVFRFIYDPYLNLFDEKYIEQFNIIVYNKYLPLKDNFRGIFLKILNKYNIKLIYDIDDYWEVEKTHPSYEQVKKINYKSLVLRELNECSSISTTTEYFKDIIKEYTTNKITVLSNAINTKEQQWQINNKKTNRCRFLWAGGSSHLEDLKILQNGINKMGYKYPNTSQFILGGFDINNGEDIEKSIWYKYEKIFTNNYNFISENKSLYLEYNNNNLNTNDFYRRICTKSIYEYGSMYNQTDVSLIPLVETYFNKCKSQLKTIESGFHKCPVIVSNIEPYSFDDIQGEIDGSTKGLFIDNDKEWFDAYMYYMENKDMIKEHGNNLYNYVNKYYNINVINKERIKLIKNI